MPVNIDEILRRLNGITNALDAALYPVDPLGVEDMSNDEIRSRYPVAWARMETDSLIGYILKERSKK